MLLVIGITIGLILGLTGAGGSVFAVPLLMLLGGLAMNDAIGISLGAVAVSTIYGSLRNLRNNTILWVPAVILAGAGILTAPVGKWLGTKVPELWLLIGFSVLAIIIAMRMLVTASRNPEAAQIVRAATLSNLPDSGLRCSLSFNGQFKLSPPCVSGLVAGGLLTGLLSGLFGVGGGFLIIPVLLFLSQVSMTQAVSTSLVIITLISGSGFVSHLLLSTQTNMAMNWITLAWVAAGGLAGMFAGQWLSRLIAGAKLQQLFAICLLCVAFITVYFHP